MKNLSSVLRHPLVLPLRFMAIAIAALACLAPRCAAQDKKLAGIRTVDGAAIFRDYCASCHGTDGKGHGPVAPALKLSVPDLTHITQRAGVEFPRARVRAIIEGKQTPVGAHGSREMPIWGPVFHQIDADQDLGNVRIDNLAKYIESIQTQSMRQK